ncbi:MAG: hypothetical protein IJ465_01875 [Clostridia bacterium]|nr:hypothetical protein [Clostridia bacterium]
MNPDTSRVYTRKNHRRVRSLQPMDYVSPYIMVERQDACNSFTDSFDAAPVDAYIRKKRKEGLENFGLLHVLLAAYIRTAADRPGINRFIRGQKIYTRDRLVVCMDVKREMTVEGETTVIKPVFLPTDTADDVYRVFNDLLQEATQDTETGFDSLAKVINYIPGLVKKFVVWLLKLLDYFGWLPTALTNLSPFHGSLFITSMGSLGIPPIYHHLYNFGNIPAFLAYGRRRHANELNVLGQMERRSYYDVAMVLDERICNGFYYASAWKHMKHILKNPDILDTVPEVTPDIP